jgi:preprotein translocase subunit SecA
MNDHSDLGLANEPETEEAQLIYDALKQSYDYTLVGDCEVNMLTATQRVSMRYLDIGDLTSTLGDLTAAKLKIIVQTRDRSLVYADNDQYLPEVTQEAYAAALNQALKNAKNSYKQIEFDLTLDYTGGKWQLSTAPELLMALSGGTMS